MGIPSLFSVNHAGFWGQHRLHPPSSPHKATQPGYPAVEFMGKGFIHFKRFFAGLAEGGLQGYTACKVCLPLRDGGSKANLHRVATISLNKSRQLVGQTDGRTMP